MEAHPLSEIPGIFPLLRLPARRAGNHATKNDGGLGVRP
jgi:hypothetical protein